ncbi:hypothetical protein FF2_002499 [Malus domestica]
MYHRDPDFQFLHDRLAGLRHVSHTLATGLPHSCVKALLRSFFRDKMDTKVLKRYVREKKVLKRRLITCPEREAG